MEKLEGYLSSHLEDAAQICLLPEVEVTASSELGFLVQQVGSLSEMNVRDPSMELVLSLRRWSLT